MTKILDLDFAPAAHRDEILSAARRAIDAGAHPPLTFMGMGMSGIVFCDDRDHGFKVGRSVTDSLIEEEAEWLAVASTVPWVRDHVAHFVRFDPDQWVIERQCIVGSRPPSGKKDLLWDLMIEIGKVMAPYGLGTPEFKQDSFVWQRGRGWVLVDAGFSHKKGNRLVRDAILMLTGRKKADARTLTDTAWAVRWEGGRTIDPTRADRLSERLLSMAERKL